MLTTSAELAVLGSRKDCLISLVLLAVAFEFSSVAAVLVSHGADLVEVTLLAFAIAAAATVVPPVRFASPRTRCT